MTTGGQRIHSRNFGAQAMPTVAPSPTTRCRKVVTVEAGSFGRQLFLCLEIGMTFCKETMCFLHAISLFFNE